MQHAPSLRPRLARGLALASAAILLFAAGAKLFDLASFRESLESWSVIPWFLRDFVSVGVPSAELTIGLLIVLRQHERAALAAGIGLVAAFSGAALAQHQLGELPACRCLGSLLAFEQTSHAAWWLFARNAVIVTGLVLAFRWTAARPPAPLARAMPSP